MLMRRPRDPHHRDTLTMMARAEWPRWLMQFHWELWMTLTTQEPTTASAIVRSFIRWQVREMARKALGPVPYFYMVEQKPSGFVHLHALAAGTGQLPVKLISGLWGLGYADVARYNPRLSAAHYMTKDMLLDLAGDHYDISRRLPPLVSQRAA